MEMDKKQSKLQVAETIKHQKMWLKDSIRVNYEQKEEYQKEIDNISKINCDKIQRLVKEYLMYNKKNKFRYKLLR